MNKEVLEQAKARVGEQVAQWVTTGMVVGLGTGSTAAYAIRAIGRRVKEEGLRVTGVPTSYSAELLARMVGIPVATPGEVERIDLAIDGADEVDPELRLIKGRGAAHTRERIVAAMAERFVVVADFSKEVAQLGEKMPVPVEVLPFAWRPVERSLQVLGGKPVLRMGMRKDGPVITDQGFWILDVKFESMGDPREVASMLKTLPGVLDHGLFIDETTDVLIATAEGTIVHRRRT